MIHDMLGGVSINGWAFLILPFTLACLFVVWLILVSRQRRGMKFELRGLGVRVNLEMQESRSRRDDAIEQPIGN